MDLNRVSVLIVDDNPNMRAMLLQMLRAMGVGEVIPASDGSQALALLDSRMVDIIITDLVMKPLGGLEFVREIRRSRCGANRLVPIIMLTGHGTPQHVREARDAGVSGMLAKPLTARGLASRLNAAIMSSRPFVQTESFFGPDRRRGDAGGYAGPRRRSSDADVPAAVADLIRRRSE